MVQEKITIALYLSCVTYKKYTWEDIKEFAYNTAQFRAASDEEVYEVYTEIKKNYPYGFKS